MSQFQYIARTASAAQVTGVVEAGSTREALEQLAQRRLLTVAIQPAPPPATWPMLARGVNPRRMAALYGQLADLLRSGVPLLRSIEVVERQCADTRLQIVLGDLRDRLGDGASLSEAMSVHRPEFGELAINMVRAGEEGGFLNSVLRRIADFTRGQQSLKSRVTGAMAYPVFLLGVTLIVLIVMMTVFVPNFAPIFDRMREAGHLPALTEGLLATSALIQANAPVLVGGLLVLMVASFAFARSDAGQLAFDRFKLWMPGLRNFCRGFAIARFARIFGTMLSGGVPILTALQISKDSAGNRVLAAAIGGAADNLERGEGLAGPLRDCGVLPDDVIEMIAVGEESNNLPEVLVDVAETTEQRLSEQLDVLLRLLEPVLLLVMAGITLLIVAALLLPVFKMGQVM